jgi:hypothetical protein
LIWHAIIFVFLPKISLALVDKYCRMMAYQGETIMSIFEDTDTINAILAELADREIVEPMAEPIDETDCHPLDWAEVVGITDEVFDEIYPGAAMVDESGITWYVS